MPLKDHFHPPIWTRASWEDFHWMWPATMVQRLVNICPKNLRRNPESTLGHFLNLTSAPTTMTNLNVCLLRTM